MGLAQPDNIAARQSALPGHVLGYYNNHPLCGYSVGERQERASFLLLMQSIHTFCIGWYLAVCLFLNYTTIFTEYKPRNRCGYRNLAKKVTIHGVPGRKLQQKKRKYAANK